MRKLLLLTLVLIGPALSSCVKNDPIGAGAAGGFTLIEPSSVTMNTGKSRMFRVSIDGQPYEGTIVYDFGGGTLVPLAEPGTSRYTGGALQGQFTVAVTLPDEGLSDVAAVILSSFGFGFQSPFRFPGTNNSTLIVHAAVSGPTAAFASLTDTSKTSSLIVVDLASNAPTSTITLPSFSGSPSGVVILPDGNPLAIFQTNTIAPPLGNFETPSSLVLFEVDAGTFEELPVFFIHEIGYPPHLTIDPQGIPAVAEVQTLAAPGGAVSYVVNRVILTDGAPPALEFGFDIELANGSLTGLVVDAQGFFLVATETAVYRHDPSNPLLTDESPIFSASFGTIRDIAVDAEGAIYVAAGGEIIILNELGEIVHVQDEIQLETTANGFIRGDIDGNEIVDMADVDQLQLYLQGGASVDCEAALDANGDDLIDASDITFLTTFLSALGPPPPSPFPECGLDPGTAFGCSTPTCLTGQTESLLALATDPFADPNSPSDLVAVEDWVDASNSNAAVVVVYNPQLSSPGIAPKNLLYNLPFFILLGQEFSTAPSVQAGIPSLYEISPPLPQGIQLDAITGLISGTPTVATPEIDYVVTASNEAGEAQVVISIRVFDENEL